MGKIAFIICYNNKLSIIDYKTFMYEWKLNGEW